MGRLDKFSCIAVLAFVTAGAGLATGALPAAASPPARPTTSSPIATAGSPPSPLGTPGQVQTAAQPVPNQYLVTLKTTPPAAVPSEANRLATQHGGTVFHVYQHALRGFAVRMSAAQAVAVSEDPAVASVHQDGVVHATTVQNPVPIGATGIDRIDQHTLPLDQQYHYGPTAANVRAYIIDTGIQTNVADFGGRATFGDDEIGGVTPHGTDCHGHGTHVSGTLGGTLYGVAKQVNLVEVRVLDCTGSGSDTGVAAGVDWVTANAIKPAVANLSLGGSQSTVLDTAILNSESSGVAYAVAAGNNAGNACQLSPADLGGANSATLTVAASDATNDTQASFSNFGSCVDLYGPGVNIRSDGTNTGAGLCPGVTCTLSGTSMATPHVAGTAALYLSGHTTATPPQVKAAVTTDATPGVISNATPGTPNKLDYTGASPPALTATGNGSTNVHLSWTAPTSDGGSPITGYNVYRGTTAGGEGSIPLTTVGSGTTTYDDLALTCGTARYYQVSAVNAVGETRSAEQVASPCGSTYTALPPHRILDTRPAPFGPIGVAQAAPIGANQILTLNVTGGAGNPPNDGHVTSVVMNVTATDETTAGFLTVYPFGQATIPLASNVNMSPGRDVSNLVTVEVDVQGRVNIFNGGGATDVVADVVGYFNDGPPNDVGSKYNPQTPTRILDTRTALGGHPGPLGGGQTFDLTVSNLCTNPTAAVVNITATNQTNPSFLTVYPTGGARPNASNLNIYPSTNIAVLGVVKLGGGSNNQVTIYNNVGTTDVVVDLTGCYSSTAGQQFTATSPARILDTRTNTGGHPGPLGQHQTLNLAVAGQVPIPAGTSAALINVTATNATTPSFLTVFPQGASQPVASTLNVYPGQNVPNLDVAALQASGVSIYNDLGSVDVVGDVSGFYQ